MKTANVLSIRDIAVIAGIHPDTLKSRIKSGMTLENALLTPIRKRNNTFTVEEYEIARRNGVSRRAANERLRRGFSVKDSISMKKNQVLEELRLRKRKEERSARNLPATNDERKELRIKRKAERLKRAKILKQINELQKDASDKTTEQLLELGKQLARSI